MLNTLICSSQGKMLAVTQFAAGRRRSTPSIRQRFDCAPCHWSSNPKDAVRDRAIFITFKRLNSHRSKWKDKYLSFSVFFIHSLKNELTEITAGYCLTLPLFVEPFSPHQAWRQTENPVSTREHQPATPVFLIFLVSNTRLKLFYIILCCHNHYQPRIQENKYQIFS